MKNEYDKELIREIPNLNIRHLTPPQLEIKLAELLAPIFADTNAWGRFKLEYSPATWAVVQGEGCIVSKWIKRKTKKETVLYEIKDVRKCEGLNSKQWNKLVIAVYTFLHPSPYPEQKELF